jgi:hypothetical protein
VNDSVLNAFLNHAHALPVACHVPVIKGNDVEKPRSLFKSGIVE